MVERIALVDMDGTVADYDAGIRAYYDDMNGPGERGYHYLSQQYGHDQWPNHLWKRIELIKSQPRWWRNLPPLAVGFEIVHILQDDFNFEIFIASKGPSSKPQAWAEKVEWARHWMPYADVHITEKKSMLYGGVLVDDFPDYAMEWLHHRPRGLVVMPAHHYNEHVDHPQVMRYTEGMQEQLKKRLERLLS